MKQPGFVIAIALLILSACGDKNEQKSAVAPASTPLVEQNTMVATDQSITSPTKDKVSEMALPASTDATAPAVASIAEPPIVKPKKEKVPEKAVQGTSAPKPISPAKTEKPLPTNNGMKDELLSREEGLALANRSGCLVCHRIETKLVGPAWRDVSKRYKGDPDAKARLITKVKIGGKGNWTEVTGGIAMPPNSPRVSDENIEKLVTFVLSQ